MATAVTPNTVLKACRELEREGLVEPGPGLGTFVRRSLARDDTAADGPLRAALGGWMRQAHEAGLEIDDVHALFAAVRDTYHLALVPGNPVDSGYVDAAGEETHNPLAAQGCASGDHVGCLGAAGATQQFIRYQPDSRYWPFQAIETAIRLIARHRTRIGGGGGARERPPWS